MIPKGTNVVVNFYVTDSNGVPLSTASGITPHYRLNGGSSNSLTVAISSLGSDAPGWFRFSTAQFNNSTGNLFITFSNSSNYVIMPWEDDIVPVGGATASDIWNYSFSGNNASSHLYNASANAGSAYIAVGGIDIPTPPTTDAIAASVWTYGDGSANVNRIVNNTIPTVESIQAGLATAANVQAVITRGNEAWTTATGFATAADITTKLTDYGAAKTTDIPTPPTADTIAASVWTYSTQGNPSSDRSLTYYPAVPNDYAKPGDEMALTAAAVTSVQTGLAKTTDIPTVPTAGDIATSVWGYTIGNPAASASTYLGSIGNIPQATWNYSWGTTVTSASVYLNSIYNNTSNITIPTPPTAGDIASSVWNYTDGTRGLTTSFYGTGATSRFAVKDDIVATPGGITAADVWNYSIGNTSAISFIQGISTNTNSISLNTGSIATSYATIAGSIGTNTTDITSIKTSIGSIDTSIGSINTTLGTIGGGITAVTNSVIYNNAALLNWSLSTASTLALHVGNTTTTYSIARDLAGNITGVSPNN